VRKLFSSLRARLALWYIGILTVLLVFLNIFLYLTLQRFLAQDLTSALRERGRAINNQLSVPLPEETREQRLKVILNVPGTPSVHVVLYDSNGNPVASSNAAPDGTPRPDEQMLRLANLPSGQLATVQRWQAPWGEQYLYLWQIVRPRRGPPFIALLITSSERIGSTLRQLLVVMLLGDGAVLLLAGLMGLPLISAALRPLGRMAEATQRIAAGDLGKQVYLPSGQDEMGQLSASFNDMVDQLRASFQAQRRFIADASHELRSPLTALQGSTEVLLMGAASDPKISYQMLRSMNREIDRLIRLVNDLLTLSKFDADLPMRRERVDLAGLLAETVDQVRTMAAPRQVSCAFSGPVFLQGDRDRLKQVFLNIAENAVRHTTPEGHIEIGLRQEDGWATVTLKDDGEGISPDDLSHIFERFYSSDRSRSRPKSGTGLGLAIAKAIVEAHSGTIGVTGRPGEGAAFEVRLPVS